MNKEEIMDKATAIVIAANYGLEREVKESIEHGMSPFDALRDWDLI